NITPIRQHPCWRLRLFNGSGWSKLRA
ncbi:putative acid--amine ligase YjfC, partial [Haemophilus influenzae]